MINKEDVSAVLELIRPSLQADGGDVELVDVAEDGTVTVELVGACKGCPLSPDDAGKRRRAHPEEPHSRRHQGCSRRLAISPRTGSTAPPSRRICKAAIGLESSIRGRLSCISHTLEGLCQQRRRFHELTRCLYALSEERRERGSDVPLLGNARMRPRDAIPLSA